MGDGRVTRTGKANGGAANRYFCKPVSYALGYGACVIVGIDRLVIGVAHNPGKNPLMPLDERIACVEEALPAIRQNTGGDILVVPFDSLLVKAVREHGATLIFRGLRVLSDFDYEIQMSGVNRKLDAGIESVFLMASERTQFISSRLVKEIASYGGDISEFVTPGTQVRLLAHLADRKNVSA